MSFNITECMSVLALSLSIYIYVGISSLHLGPAAKKCCQYLPVKGVPPCLIGFEAWDGLSEAFFSHRLKNCSCSPLVPLTMPHHAPQPFASLSSSSMLEGSWHVPRDAETWRRHEYSARKDTGRVQRLGISHTFKAPIMHSQNNSKLVSADQKSLRFGFHTFLVARTYVYIYLRLSWCSQSAQLFLSTAPGEISWICPFFRFLSCHCVCWKGKQEGENW